ncbi:MAG TPA: OsmC family protein [Chromatiaceae bacterium]|jgi:organic hydroperoxide reductase OsmC/OhrA|nr:OsmC family protein [Chromatiaceae bacterium]
MSEEEGRFTIHLEQLEDYQINVRFDWKKAADLLMDEPPPLGEAAGPNASRLLAAAAANCMTASLLYCLAKDAPPAHSIRTEASCVLVRNEKKRARIGRMEVKLRVSDELARSARFGRCKDLFEDFCVVSSSIRQGIPISVQVLDAEGQVLHSSE